MPWGATVGTNGLKSCVMLFSGELSMTSVWRWRWCRLLEVAELEAPVAPPVLGRSCSRSRPLARPP